MFDKQCCQAFLLQDQLVFTLRTWMQQVLSAWLYKKVRFFFLYLQSHRDLPVMCITFWLNDYSVMMCFLSLLPLWRGFLGCKDILYLITFPTNFTDGIDPQPGMRWGVGSICLGLIKQELKDTYKKKNTSSWKDYKSINLKVKILGSGFEKQIRDTTRISNLGLKMKYRFPNVLLYAQPLFSSDQEY